MRYTLNILTAASALTAASMIAAPLSKNKVSKDAKWVLHLDVDAFRQSEFGSYLVSHILEPKLDAAKSANHLNFSMTFSNIASITAYGPNYEKNGEGVLLLETSANVKQDLDALVGLAALKADSGKKASIVQTEPYLLYNLNDELFVAPNVKRTVILAKSKEQIARAREVLLGASENLTASHAFENYPDANKTFFFMGMAEGFNQNMELPAKAQVLKEAAGGQVVLGERGKNLCVNVVFKGKDQESTTNISQILQGLVALVRITQPDPDVAEFANSAKISTELRNVNVSFEVPVSRALSKLKEKQDAN